MENQAEDKQAAEQRSHMGEGGGRADQAGTLCGYFQPSATQGNKGTTPAECACALNPGVISELHFSLLHQHVL